MTLIYRPLSWIVFITIFFSLHLQAQPGNDNFGSAYDISGLINSCSANAAYTTVAATPDMTAGTCAPNGPNYNVWFKFKASATGYMHIQLKTVSVYGNMQYS